MQTKEAIVLAGGLGTRLKGVVSDTPKPMASVANQPFLKYIFDYLITQGIERVILSVGYKYEHIKTFFGDHYLSLELIYSVEETLLGTGGGIRLSIDYLKSDSAFIINGDTFFDVDLEKMETFFTSTNSDLCLALKPMKDFDRYGAVVVEDDKISSFKEKQFVKEGLINGGIYLMESAFLKDFKSGEMFSFEQYLMEKRGRKKKITGFISDTYFIDIGIPKDYKQANIDFDKLRNHQV